jgi:hypothetical protein
VTHLGIKTTFEEQSRIITFPGYLKIIILVAVRDNEDEMPINSSSENSSKVFIPLSLY